MRKARLQKEVASRVTPPPRHYMQRLFGFLGRGLRKLPSFLAKAAEQTVCWLSWPPFSHVYDQVFVERKDKRFSLYDHCMVCGRARCWVGFTYPHKQPGSITIGPWGTYYVDADRVERRVPDRGAPEWVTEILKERGVDV